MKADEYPDISFLGKFTDDAEPWAIVRADGDYLANLGADYELPAKGREFRFFRPYAGGEPEGTPTYLKYGLQDWKRAEGLNRGDWYFIGIYAEAEVSYAIDRPGHHRLEWLRSGGLWGIESDAGDYLQEVARDELANLHKHLRAFGVSLAGWKDAVARMTDMGFDHWLDVRHNRKAG